MLNTNVAVCHRCPHRGPLTEGKCACLIDPERRDIITHAERLGCPENRFPKPEPKPNPEPEPPRPHTPVSITQGAKGIAKAIFGAGGADEATVKQRTDICQRCENAILSLGVLSRCGLCGCSTWAKVRNADQHCPIGKW